MLRHTNEGRTLLELAVERGLVSAERAASAGQQLGEQDGGDRLVQLGLLDEAQLNGLREVFQQELRTRSNFAPASDVSSRSARPLVNPPAPSAGSTSRTERIGHYRLGRELGRGAMGVVYRARDERRAMEVAIKLLPPDVAGDPLRRRRLLEEARKAAMMEHCPHVVTVFEAGVVDDRAYLAMELVEGKTLEDWLRQPGGEESTADLLLQLVDGVAAAHSVGLVHRDIKPSNLMVTSRGVLKILDFGLAKDLVGPRLEDSIDSVVGTPVYMAPELLQMALGLVPMDEAAARSARIDVYAVGITACEALGRGRPFAPVLSYGQLLEQKLAVQQIVRRALGKRPLLPWRHVVPQMLAFDPMARPADGKALQHLLQGTFTSEAKAPAAGRRLGGLAAGAAGLALAAAALSGLLPFGAPVGTAIGLLAATALALLRRRPRTALQTPARHRVSRSTEPESESSLQHEIPPVLAAPPRSRPSTSRAADQDGPTRSPAPGSSFEFGSPLDGGVDGADQVSRSMPMRRITDLVFREEYWIGPFCLKICVGDLTRLGAEGWVSPDDSLLTMGGGVSAAIAARLGAAHRRAVAARAPAPVGTVVVTDIGSPPVRHVLHAITIGVDEAGHAMRPTLATIAGCATEIFQHARRLRLRTLAIPALGTGAGGLPPLDVAKILCGRAIEQLADRTNNTLQTIVFVASRADDPLLAAIRSHILDAGPREMVVRRGSGPAWGHGADSFASVE